MMQVGKVILCKEQGHVYIFYAISSDPSPTHSIILNAVINGGGQLSTRNNSAPRLSEDICVHIVRALLSFDIII